MPDEWKIQALFVLLVAVAIIAVAGWGCVIRQGRCEHGAHREADGTVTFDLIEFVATSPNPDLRSRSNPDGAHWRCHRCRAIWHGTTFAHYAAVERAARPSGRTR